MTATLNMDGPFNFTKNGIENAVKENKKGNYALGRKGDDGTFFVSYIGRSDNDLRQELLVRLDTHKHSHFKASYANSAEEAFKKECQNYHDFDPEKLENEIHPDKPNGTLLKCPVCHN
ncbi:MAG: hypothetical protein K5793_02515 [Nitrosarchaeum sp.]|nr:hypothetical protein [Nitrosarchaeum sp.]